MDLSKFQLSDLDRLLLMAAAVRGRGARSDIGHANTAVILVQVLEWSKSDSSVIIDSWERGEHHPYLLQVYESLVRMTQQQLRSGGFRPAERPGPALFEGSGNWGVPGDKSRPPADPRFNSCRLTALGEQVANALLAQQPEYRNPSSVRSLDPLSTKASHQEGPLTATVRKYIYDGDAVLQETDGAGNVLTEYTRTGGGYGDLLSAYDGTSVKYFEPDGLGSTDALADQSQTVVDRWSYRAFGTAVQTAGTDATPFTWVGRQGYFSDSETGLYLLGSGTRHYDPLTAQFLSKDPIGFDGGDVNLYRFVANTPEDSIDPLGLRAARPDGTLAPLGPPAGPGRPPLPRPPGAPGGPVQPGGFAQIIGEADKRCWDMLYDEIKSMIRERAENPPGGKAGHSTKSDRRGGRLPGGIGNKINGVMECLEKFEKGEAPAEKFKACLDAACEFVGEAGPAAVFCKIWKGIMFVDACAAAAVLNGGKLILPETLPRLHDDFYGIDCKTRKNRVSCVQCCKNQWEGVDLDAVSKCIESAGCASKPEFGSE